MISRNRRMFELRLGKLGLILFIGGMSLMLFGLFLLGVLVGKHLETYPDQYARGIPDLLRERFFTSPGKKDGAQQTRREGQDHPVDDEEDFDLTFFDTLAGKKRESAKGVSPRPAKPEETETALLPTVGAASTSPAPMDKGAASLVRRMDSGVKTVSPPEARGGRNGPETRTLPPGAGPPVTMKAPLGKDLFEVQAAAYREKGRAEQLVQKLRDAGFAAQVVMRDIPEKGRWFRVVAGGFDNREKAQVVAKQMALKIKGLKSVVRVSGKDD
jgi:cell division protein FtsN